MALTLSSADHFMSLIGLTKYPSSATNQKQTKQALYGLTDPRPEYNIGIAYECLKHPSFL